MNIAIFASGSGTNCENLIKHFADSESVKVALVVSNKPDAFVLERVRRFGVPTAITPKASRLPDRRLPTQDHQYPPCPAAEIRWQGHVGTPCTRGGESRW